nr:YqgE/AlgH family protein [Nocardioides convexus]
MLDPNFADTVVLLLDVNDEGALGVVLNRPSALPVSEVLGEWGDVVDEPEVLFQGGPVATDGALAVALAAPGGEGGAGFRPVWGRLGLLDLDTPREPGRGHGRPAADLRRVRRLGCRAAWRRRSPRGAWYVVPGEVEDVFGDEAPDLRRQVLRRQPGDLALHATRPMDPETN